MKGTLRITWLLLFFSVCLSGAWAFEDRTPPVTTNTLTGVWEAISDRSFRVFQLELSAQGGVLTYGTCYLKTPRIYHLTELHVMEDGLLRLGFVNDKKERILIYGSGQASKEEGILDVLLDMNPEGTPNIWKLEFIRIDGDLTYVEMLGELSIKASKGRREAKKKESGLKSSH